MAHHVSDDNEVKLNRTPSAAPKSRTSLSPLTTTQRLNMFQSITKHLPLPSDTVFYHGKEVITLDRMDAIDRYLHVMPTHVESHVSYVSTLEINVYIEDHLINVGGLGRRDSEEVSLAVDIPSTTWKANDPSYFLEEIHHSKRAASWWRLFSEDVKRAAESMDQLLTVTVNTYPLNDETAHAQLVVMDVQKWLDGDVKAYVVDPDGSKNANKILLPKLARSLVFTANRFLKKGDVRIQVTSSVLKSPFLNISKAVVKTMRRVDARLNMKRTDDIDIGQCVSVCTFIAFLLATTGRRVLKKEFFDRNIIAPLIGETKNETSINILAFFRAWSHSLVSSGDEKPSELVSFDVTTGEWTTKDGIVSRVSKV